MVAFLVVLPFLCVRLRGGEAKALWRWSNYLQSMDLPERQKVLINMGETSVRLVPQEGRGHVSQRAYRLFVQGVPVGRRASLAKQRSTITHVAAISGRPHAPRLVPEVVLVGRKQFAAARLAALPLDAPECARMWKYPKGWMTTVIMVKYVRCLGQGLKEFCSSHRFILYIDAL